jgi:DNA-binding NarL/FixJ family response regulator
MPKLHLSSRRVFIMGDNSLFEEGIAQLLAFGADLSISNTKYTDDPAFLDAIAQNRPDVILLNESSCDSAHIIELLFSTPALTAQYIIVVRLSNSMVDVFEMPKRFTITKQDELVAVVQGNFKQI